MARTNKITLKEMVESVVNAALERKPAAGLTRQDLEDQYVAWMSEKDSQGKERWDTFKYQEKQVDAALDKYWDSYISAG